MENLLFVLEVQDYKSVEAPGYQKSLARKIFKKYVKVNAPMGIAVEHRTRLSVADGYEKATGALSHDLFDGLVQEVVLSMKLDILPRFVESPEYKKLMALKFEERKVVDMTEFDCYRFLGAGGFGMVLLAKQFRKKKQQGSPKRDKFYAVKVIDKRILISQNQTHSIYREKEVLAIVEHPYIIALRYAFQTPDHLCLVLDYIEGGNMYSDLQRGPYTHERACFYAAEIVLATQHLHELNILYRDLKPDNVLLTVDGNVKLADMGAARGVEEDGKIKGGTGTEQTETADRTAKSVDPLKGRRMTITGTHGYRAPEVYERDYGKAADWWNVGILIIEMLTAENPLRGENRRESEVLTKTRDLTHVLPAYLQQTARDVVLAFLQRDPSKRLGCGAKGVPEIKEHPFFEPIDWVALLAMEMPVPFEPDTEYIPPERQPIPKEYTYQLDYFCQMVDYLKTSMSMRESWKLSEAEHKIFEGFDFVSNQVFEEDLNSAYRDLSEGFGGLDLSAGASG